MIAFKAIRSSWSMSCHPQIQLSNTLPFAGGKCLLASLGCFASIPCSQYLARYLACAQECALCHPVHSCNYYATGNCAAPVASSRAGHWLLRPALYLQATMLIDSIACEPIPEGLVAAGLCSQVPAKQAVVLLWLTASGATPKE